MTSANVACGFHAGDPDIMATTFARAKEKGVAVGAHVAFPDLAGFGRRSLPMSAREIERAVAYQLGAAQALAALSGHRITHVKAHGALANIAERDADVANAIARAVRGVDPSLALLAIALSEQTHAGARAGLRVVNEIFADRAYMDDGRLQPRSEEGAVIEDIERACARVRDMLASGGLRPSAANSCRRRSTRSASTAIRRLRLKWPGACARRSKATAGSCAPSQEPDRNG